MSVNMHMNILVVDDPHSMKRVVKELLESIGFANVYETTDGNEALSKLDERLYGLVVSDWNLQNMTGLDLLRIIRERGSKVPFVMVTAETRAEIVLAARDAGVSGYLVKPINAGALKTRLHAVFGAF